MSIIIEFIAPPGTGKTTITNKIIKDENLDVKWHNELTKLNTLKLYTLRAHKLKLHILKNSENHIIKKMSNESYTFLFNNNEEIKVFTNLLETKKENHSENMKTTSRRVEILEDLKKIYKIKKKHQEKTFYFDELLIHSLILYFYSINKKPEEIKDIIYTIPKSDLYVFLNCNINICLKRVIKRDGKKRDINEIKYYFETLPIVKNELKKAGCRIIELNDEDDNKSLIIRKIVNQIRQN